MHSHQFSTSFQSLHLDDFVVISKLNEFNHVNFIVHIVMFRLQYDIRVYKTAKSNISGEMWLKVNELVQ